jgi:hypothetical protein
MGNTFLLAALYLAEVIQDGPDSARNTVVQTPHRCD